MNTIYITVAVDTVGALAADSLEDYVYMVDSNKYLGSWQEGASQLNTVCQNGQIIVWSAQPLNAGNSVEISGLTASMVDQKICVPKMDIMSGVGSWAGRVETQGSYGSYVYTLSLNLGARKLSFNSAIKVV
jgi:hypothetical protein